MAASIVDRFPAFAAALALAAAALLFAACGLLPEEVCGSAGDRCRSNGDCCEGFGCFLGSCVSPDGSPANGSTSPSSGSGSTSGGVCAQPGELCNPTPCCDPELPDGGGANVCSWGAVCQACMTAGDVCNSDSDCCAGLSCSNSTCTGSATMSSTGGTSGGSSTTAANSSFGGSSSSGGVCAAYGASCQPGGCCGGLSCDATAGLCYARDGESCAGSQDICANGDSCIAGICFDCGRTYGADCSESYCCTSGLTCDPNQGTCFVASGSPCTEDGGACLEGDACLSSGVCGAAPPCANYGETGCNAGGCCSYNLVCVASTDTCLIADNYACDWPQELQCADGNACPASGLCGLASSCVDTYFGSCEFQNCCAGLVCVDYFCRVADGQPCAVDAGQPELCVEPDSCDSATGLCACVPQGTSCTPMDLGGLPCCAGSCGPDAFGNAVCE